MSVETLVFGIFVCRIDPQMKAKLAGDSCAMFTHFGGPRLIALIVEFLKQTGTVAYWPGEAPCGAVADVIRPQAVVKQHLTRVLQPIMKSRPSKLLDDAIVGVRNLVSSSKIIRQS